MSQSKEVRYTFRSITPPPNRRGRSRSLSRSRGRSRSRSQDSRDARNPGNNLYVTGLSTRITSSDLEKYFSKEGSVQECHVVIDARTKESRGFGFVTMETVEDADRCIRYLNHSVLEGRIITVEKVVVVDIHTATHLIDLVKEIALIRGADGKDPTHHMDGSRNEGTGSDRFDLPEMATSDLFRTH